MERAARRIFLALVLVVPHATAEPVPFEFPLPEGFVSLKEESAAPPMTRIEDFYYEQAKSFPTYAVHIGPDGVDATYRAQVSPGVAPLAQWQGFAEKAIASSGLQDAKRLSSRLVDIANVRGGRIELEARVEGREYRQLSYVLPGRAHWAVVVLTADRAEYERAAAAAEAAILKIGGLSAPAESSNAGSVIANDARQAKLGMTLLLGAGCGLLLNKILRRRKQTRRSA